METILIVLLFVLVTSLLGLQIFVFSAKHYRREPKRRPSASPVVSKSNRSKINRSSKQGTSETKLKESSENPSSSEEPEVSDSQKKTINPKPVKISAPAPVKAVKKVPSKQETAKPKPVQKTQKPSAQSKKASKPVELKPWEKFAPVELTSDAKPASTTVVPVPPKKVKETPAAVVHKPSQPLASSVSEKREQVAEVASTRPAIPAFPTAAKVVESRKPREQKPIPAFKPAAPIQPKPAAASAPVPVKAPQPPSVPQPSTTTSDTTDASPQPSIEARERKNPWAVPSNPEKQPAVEPTPEFPALGLAPRKPPTAATKAAPTVKSVKKATTVVAAASPASDVTTTVAAPSTAEDSEPLPTPVVEVNQPETISPSAPIQTTKVEEPVQQEDEPEEPITSSDESVETLQTNVSVAATSTAQPTSELSETEKEPTTPGTEGDKVQQQSVEPTVQQDSDIEPLSPESPQTKEEEPSVQIEEPEVHQTSVAQPHAEPITPIEPAKVEQESPAPVQEAEEPQTTAPETRENEAPVQKEEKVVAECAETRSESTEPEMENKEQHVEQPKQVSIPSNVSLRVNNNTNDAIEFEWSAEGASSCRLQISRDAFQKDQTDFLSDVSVQCSGGAQVFSTRVEGLPMSQRLHYRVAAVERPTEFADGSFQVTPVEWKESCASAQIATDQSGWRPVDMVRTSDGAFRTVVLTFTPQVQFKVVVDGKWLTIPSFPMMQDNAGHENNVITWA